MIFLLLLLGLVRLLLKCGYDLIVMTWYWRGCLDKNYNDRFDAVRRYGGNRKVLQQVILFSCKDTSE